MEVTTEITEEKAKITIKIPFRVGKRAESLVITDSQARKILLERHPGLNISEISECPHVVDNNVRDRLVATWSFHIVKEQPKEKSKVEKTTKKPKNILNFKPKSDKVVETTAPEQTDQAKGVEEPTE